MLSRLQFHKRLTPDLATSTLFSECTFYPAFMKDLDRCKRELIIECPFITHKRMNALYPSFRRLTKRGVRVVINTRDPREHEFPMNEVAEEVVALLQDMGVMVLFTGTHHRKLAIIDGRTFYEGSLNILSQNDSCEIMRRIESVSLAQEMMRFIGVDRYVS